MAHSPTTFLLREATVGELIDNQTGWWNQTLLESMFMVEEKKAINTIPISSTNQSDRLIWQCTEMEVFLVKIAYHLAKEMERSKILEGSTRIGDSVIWKIL
jgi:hypothetical protein